MPDEELTHWGEATASSEPTKRSNADPGMVYVTDRNNNNVPRIIADLPHYCTHQNSCIGPDSDRQMIIDLAIARAQALYTFEHAKGQ
jgi:hypothetical protein